MIGQEYYFSRRQRLAFGTGILVILVFFSIVFTVGIYRHFESTNSGSLNVPSAQNPVNLAAATDTSTTPRFTLGEQVNVGNQWLITIDSFKSVNRNSGTEFMNGPHEGNQFITFSVVFQNISNSSEELFGSGNWTFKDISGYVYNSISLLHAATEPMGHVEPGGILRGDLSFEVPLTQARYVAVFSGMTSDLTQFAVVWDLTLPPSSGT